LKQGSFEEREESMALLTLIARVSDGLPLSASIVDDEVSPCAFNIIFVGE